MPCAIRAARECSASPSTSPRTAAPSHADMAAAPSATGIHNRLFLDPLPARGYPEDMHRRTWSRRRPRARPGRRPRTIIARRSTSSASTTTSPAITAARQRAGATARSGRARVEISDPEARDDGRWAGRSTRMGSNDPATGRLVTTARSRYCHRERRGLRDRVEPDGSVDDGRIGRYLERHLGGHGVQSTPGHRARVLRLVAARQLRVGRGYSQRFGVVRIDYDTLRRTPEESARWYTRVISVGGLGDGGI